MNCRKTICGLLFISAVFTVTSARAELTGLWEFNDSGNLSAATVGTDLALTGTDAAVAGVSAGDGASLVGVGSHYSVTHGIAPNGGGAFVNEYSLLMDINYPDSSAGSWIALYQTNTGNTNDGEFFIRPDSRSIGVGAVGYSDDPAIGDPSRVTDPETWYRVVLSVDNDSHFRLYVDGTQWSEGNVQGVDGRFSLDSVFLALADNDGEDNPIRISNLAVWDSPLDAAAAEGLGGPGNLVPEPSSIVLIILGLLSLAAVKFRRRFFS